MPARIPNVYHFVFGLKPQREPFHLMHYLCLASCLAVNRPDAIRVHYQHEPHGPWWERIRPQLELARIEPDGFVAGFAYASPSVARFRYAHLADFARLRILLAEGGIYADMDTLFIAPVPPAWRDAPCILGQETPPPGAAGGSLCNAWIGAEPGAAFIQAWLEASYAAFDGSWSNHSTLLPYRLSQELPQHITTKPKTAFYALDWTRRGLADLFLHTVALPADAVSLHLWSHLWFDPGRRDFLHFHADALTPDYVAFADTTYARAARRFLPADCPVDAGRYRRQRAALALRYPLHSLATRLGLR